MIWLKKKNDPKPVIEKAFNYEKVVICGQCNGRRKSSDDKGKACELCGGMGILQRVDEGVTKLYKVQ